MKTIKDFFLGISSLVAVAIGLLVPHHAFAATTPSLGAASTYGVLSSTYTNTTSTTINGDVGFTTPPAVAPLGVHVYYGSSTPYSQAGTDQATALGLLNGQACDFSFVGATDLSLETQPLVPGVYCFDDAVSISTTGVTLSGAGTYIFRIDGAFDTTVNSTVALTNGASACDVFWTPTAATTLAADTAFIGTVIDDAGITVGANTVWTGRALSFGETTTTDTVVITNPCAPTPATLTIIKQVINSGGGTGVASDFTLHTTLSGSDVYGSPFSGFGATGTLLNLYSGTYIISEDSTSLYTTSFVGDCSVTGAITLTEGVDAVCTVVNTFIRPNRGGSSSSIVLDICINGDNSPSDYDGTCRAASSSNNNNNQNNNNNNNEEETVDEPTTSDNDMEAFEFPRPVVINNPIAIVPALPLILPATGSLLEEKSKILTTAMIICVTILTGAFVVGVVRKAL